MQKARLILGIGELLWDVLPASLSHGAGMAVEGTSSVALLGGAPANFAVMAGRLGNHAAILSRIGRDDLGRKAVEQLATLPADTQFLQVDAAHDTGRVTVSFHDEHPHYTIHQPAAWDFLELSDEWVCLAERANAICFGSLAQRGGQSRKTIQSLVAQSSSSCVRVFDVNLRPPFVTGEILQESIELATVLKMNDSELPQLLHLLGQPNDEGRLEDRLRVGAQRLLTEFPTLTLVAITRGAKGSLLVSCDEWHEHAGIPVTVADTIGAGDAFTAALTHYLLRGADLAKLNDAGNRWGAWIASQRGAMPLLSDEVRDEISAAIDN